MYPYYIGWSFIVNNRARVIRQLDQSCNLLVLGRTLLKIAVKRLSISL